MYFGRMTMYLRTGHMSQCSRFKIFGMIKWRQKISKVNEFLYFQKFRTPTQSATLLVSSSSKTLKSLFKKKKQHFKAIPINVYAAGGT